MHRVIGRREDGFLVQGDSTNGSATEIIAGSRILGQVVRIERRRRRFWLGLGPERYAIVVLSRVGLLLPMVAQAGTVVRLLRKRRGEGS